MVSQLGSKGGEVVRALASHQCGPGSNPGVDAICGLSLLLVLSLAPRGFSPGTLVFPSPQKPTFPNSNSTRNQVDEESLCGCATCKSLLLYKVVPESCLAGKIFLTLVERRIWVLPSLVWTFCTVAPPCFDWQAFWLHSCFLPSIRIVESCLTSTVSFDCCCCCWMERTTVFCPCSPIFAKSLWKPTGKKD